MSVSINQITKNGDNLSVDYFVLRDNEGLLPSLIKRNNPIIEIVQTDLEELYFHFERMNTRTTAIYLPSDTTRRRVPESTHYTLEVTNFNLES